VSAVRATSPLVLRQEGILNVIREKTRRKDATGPIVAVNRTVDGNRPRVGGAELRTERALLRGRLFTPPAPNRASPEGLPANSSCLLALG